MANEKKKTMREKRKEKSDGWKIGMQRRMRGREKKRQGGG